MRKLLWGTLVLLGIAVAGSALAESATKDECVAKAKAAAQMIVDKGLDEGVAEINKKDGMFVWKDSYVFLMDFDGKMVGHPMNASLIGKNLLETESKYESGRKIFKEFVELAKGKGEGWIDYQWPKPGEDKASKKSSFIYRVPGKDLLVGAGVYE